jgi:cytoplasmic FMR1 interacting protein
MQIPEAQMVEILEAEMLKVRDLLEFCNTMIATFYETIQALTSPEAREKVVPEGLHVAMIKLIDILLKLDSLKDMKASLNNDFTRFKRAVRAGAADVGPRLAVLEALQAELQPFINNVDPRKSKMWIYHTLRAEVKRVIGHEDVLVEVLEQATSSLENHIYTTPDEKFRYMRVIPYLLMFIDGDAEDPKSINVFKGKLFKIGSAQKLFKEYPVIPLYGDMPITTYFILSKAPHFDHSMSSTWGEFPDARVVANHQLSTHWKSMKDSYAMYTTRLTTMLHRIQNSPFRKETSPQSVQFAREVYELLKSGFDRLSDWASVLAISVAWKYTHPASDDDLAKRKVYDLTTAGIQYERTVRYNFSDQELSVVVDVVAMIKSLASMMTDMGDKVAPFIRFHIHHDMQQMVQGELQPVLHRVDKRKNPVLPALLDIRALAADWLNGEEPVDDYKSYSRKQGHVSAAFPARVVSAGYTQMSLLRIQIRAIYDEKSSARQKQSFFGRAELEKEDVALLKKFYYESYHYLYMMNYSGVLLSISDLSDLWYREFFLELTSCVQFPIEMSMPWILTEHVVRQQSSKIPILENVLHTLDIYNDAAHRALYVLKQQYLYDEIEAEANLVFDQLVFLMTDEIYGYYKNFAATGLLEKDIKQKFEHLRRKAYLTTGKRRYEIPLLQKHIQLVGRSIDLNHLISQHINNYIYRDIDVAIRRFEASDATGVIELNKVLHVIRNTHKVLSENLSLDRFDSLFGETNDSVTPASFCSRINFHLIRTLVGDVFTNWSYNALSQQFLRSPMCIKPIELERAPRVDSSMGFGAQCSRAYELCNKLTRAFFGRPHLAAIVSLVKYADLTFIIQECIQFLEGKIRDLQSFVEALHEGIKPFLLPKYMYRTGGGFGLTEANLKNLFGYEDLKVGVFQNFKEVGNILGFFMDLSQVLDIEDSFQFMSTAPLFGLSPDSAAVDPQSVPLCAALLRLQAAAAGKPSLGESRKAKGCLDQIPDMCSRLTDIGSKAAGSKSLIKYVLTRIQDAMFELDIMSEWKDRVPPSNGVINAERSTDFWRLWSALSFLFCMDDHKSVSAETLAAQAGVKTEAVPHEDQFGHGFYLSGCLFIYLLDQRESFELLDFSYHLIHMHRYEKNKAGATAENAKVGQVDDALQRETTRFIINATKMQRLQNSFFSKLRALHHVPARDETTVFHAPKFSEEKEVLGALAGRQRGAAAQAAQLSDIVISRSTVSTASILGEYTTAHAAGGHAAPPPADTEAEAERSIRVPELSTPRREAPYEPSTPSTDATPPPPANPPRMSWISPGPVFKADDTPPKPRAAASPPRGSAAAATPPPPAAGPPPFPTATTPPGEWALLILYSVHPLFPHTHTAECILYILYDFIHLFFI